MKKSKLLDLPLTAEKKTGVILGERDAKYLVRRGMSWLALVNDRADAELFAASPKLRDALRGLVNVATHPKSTKAQIKMIEEECRAVLRVTKS